MSPTTRTMGPWERRRNTMTLLAEALVFPPVGWASAQAAAAPAALVAPRRLAVLLGEFAMFAIPTVNTFVTFH